MAHSARIDRRCLRLVLLALVALGAPRATYADAKAAYRQLAPLASSRRAAAETLLTGMAQAAGASTAQIEAALACYRVDVAELHAANLVAGNALQKAQVLHGFLHRRVLHGSYQVPASSVTVALTGGPYNCTSATAIFLAMASEFGLHAEAVAAPGHVWCRVADDGATFDVEATQPGWNARVSTGMENPRAGRLLNGAGLIALVHYNQGVRLHRQGRFVGAIEANRLALEFDPRCRQARENFLAAIHNWSLLLAASGQGVEALPALATGLASDPNSRTLRGDVDRWLERAMHCAEFARQ